jgi:hypothetical protein
MFRLSIMQLLVSTLCCVCNWPCRLTWHVSNKELKELNWIIWLYSPSFCPDRFFSFLILYTFGRTPWAGDQPVARPLPAHRTHTQNKRTQSSMPRVGLEPTTPVFKWAKKLCLRSRGNCDWHEQSYLNIKVQTDSGARPVSHLTDTYIFIFFFLTVSTALMGPGLFWVSWSIHIR